MSRIFGALVGLMPTGFPAMLTRILGTIPLDMSVELAKIALVVEIFDAGLPGRVELGLVCSGVYFRMDILS